MALLYDAVACLAYGVLGTLLMALGYLIVDLLTPGRLHNLIWRERNRNTAVVLAANTLGAAIVITTAIYTSEGTLLYGLAGAAIYGVIGLALMALSFVLIDLCTPGKLGEIIASPEPHPAAWVSASAHISIALVVAAAIS